MASQVSPEILGLISSAARDSNVEIYHSELSDRSLRVQVECAAGTSARTCAEYARALASRLDVAGVMRGQYDLEVSSPGVERKLYRPEDHVKALNHRVRVRTRQGLFEGRLEAADQSGVTIRPETGPAPEALRIPYAEISEAQIVVPDSELFCRAPTPGSRSPDGRNQ